MGDEAHTLKSNIDTMQINSVRNEIRMIEINGKTGVDLDIMPNYVAKVEQVLFKVMEQLKKQYGL